MGPADQPDYLNAVACLETGLDAPALLTALQEIERAHGRQRRPDRRWGPRTLDLDLLLFGDRVMTTPELTLPHPGLTERAFVVEPLLELAADLRLPDGRVLLDLRSNATAGRPLHKLGPL
jgi:2-amino-4-hydroxy-6-hydroxymethyldihydropteridine diphosphokinase